MEAIKNWLVVYRKFIFWTFCIGLILWLAITVKEVTTLLLLSYALATLIDPIVTRFERLKIPRAFSIIIIFAIITGGFAALIIFAIPVLVHEYQRLIEVLPEYLQTTGTKLASWLGQESLIDFDNLWNNIRDYLSKLGVEPLKRVALTLGKTLLTGYSLTLTLLNLTLLPFFVFYLTRDLSSLHRFIAGFFSNNTREKVEEVGSDILSTIYACVRGQLTVAIILAVLYALGLSLVGLNYALVVGTLTGLLNVVPYLGVGTGLALSIIITLVTDPSVFQCILVFSVFVVVQGLEGMLITPKIVGESVGIHPLGVILALIIGGQLFGLLGLIVAIPAVASLIVLFRYVFNELDRVGVSKKKVTKNK